MQARNVQIKKISQDTSYELSTTMQEDAVQNVLNGEYEVLFFAEHAPVYTCGTSANVERDILGINSIPAVKTGRGGQITYHGPGQRVLYPILNLANDKKDLRHYVCQLQTWIIQTLKEFNIDAHGDGEVGVWVTTSKGAAKIAAIGVRVRKWVTFHGVALNVNLNMEHYKGIVPCGISDKGVTSMVELGFTGSMADVDAVLQQKFEEIFNVKLV